MHSLRELFMDEFGFEPNRPEFARERIGDVKALD